jgi:tRNA (guanine37-N1)-methyltransferase
VNIDVFTLFPSWFDWFREQRHVRNALELGNRFDTVELRATTPLKAGQVDDTPYGGGAGWSRSPRAAASSTTPSPRSSPPSPS